MNRQTLCAAALAVFCVAAPSTAEVLRLQPDFTFKRVAVPSGNADSRITVQIDPNAPRLGPVYADPETQPQPAAVAVPDGAAPGGSLAWFWVSLAVVGVGS